MDENINAINLETASTTNALVQSKNEIYTISYLIIKRFFDITFALIGLTLLIPVAIVVKITYLLNKDFNKIIYTQTRIGKNGREFKLYKFRTMVPNADKVLEDILKKDENVRKEWEENQKLDNDPRITKIGKILRKTSLDELPQFICILADNMSLVGPRPLVKNELSAHGGNHKIYESVKPGITGWWACNGRSCLDYHDRLMLEYYYVINRNLKLDIKCILKTISAVIIKRGAK